MNELPSITSSSYTTNTISPALFVQTGNTAPNQILHDWNEQKLATSPHRKILGQAVAAGIVNSALLPSETPMSLRLVRVIIADPCESLPLEKRVLYRGEEQTTDLTDQELYYEISIKELLDKHNEFRVTVNDKTKKERTKLAPIRIRDLKMVVVQIAAF